MSADDTLAASPQGRHDHLAPADVGLAIAAVAVVAVLQLLVVNDVAVGPRWAAPAIELIIFAPIVVAAVWHHRRLRTAASHRELARLDRQRRYIRIAALTLAGLMTLMNLGALGRLVHALVAGHGEDARTLLVDAANIWLINVIIFALWFWALDVARSEQRPAQADFVFTQEQSANVEAFRRWAPGFLDYIFLAFTTATAFSPCDTAPLSRRAKIMMMLEASISLVTIAVVAARAVGIISPG